LELTLYRDVEGFAALRDEWNALLARSAFNAIFMTWEWQVTWWQSIGATRGPLYLLAARQADRLVGIIPLYLTREAGSQTLHVIGCIEVADYLDFIVEVGQEQAVYSAFLRWLAGLDAPTWDCLDLCNQPQMSQAHTLLPALAGTFGWAAEVAVEDVCPIAPLPHSFDAYLESLDKKQRHEVRRKLRRIEREAPDAHFRLVTGGADLAPAVEAFIRLHRLSSAAKDAFMTPEMQAYFHALARTAADAGWLHLSFLDIGGDPAATYFCFDYRNQLLVYNSGYDPVAYPQLSAGWVLLSYVVQNAITMGRTHIDFLQGNEDYKYRFGGVDTLVYRTLIRRV
jgi:CelD/BcsL family acetyltransferase involved in cellulose biosynthesis